MKSNVWGQPGPKPTQTRTPKPAPRPKPMRTVQPRNWRRLVLMGLAGVIVLGSAIALFVFSMLKRSEPAQFALERARTHPAAIAKTGMPLEVGWVVSGSLRYNGSAGTVRLALPVRGPNGGGTIHVRGVKRDGRWSYSELRMAPADGTRAIDLRH